MLENIWQRLRSNPRVWMAAATVLTAVLVMAWWGRHPIEHRLYPFRYRDEIVTYAKQNNLDPLYVAAIIKNESRFNPGAISNKGAIGLMQVMPDTGRWVAEKMGFAGFHPDMLHDPATNIMIGTWYLAELRREFAGKIVLVTAAYNAGRGQVKTWAENNKVNLTPNPAAELAIWPGPVVSEDFPVTEIRIKETRGYVKGVLWTLQRYRELYGRETAPASEPAESTSP